MGCIDLGAPRGVDLGCAVDGDDGILLGHRILHVPIDGCRDGGYRIGRQFAFQRNGRIGGLLVDRFLHAQSLGHVAEQQDEYHSDDSHDQDDQNRSAYTDNERSISVGRHFGRC